MFSKLLLFCAFAAFRRKISAQDAMFKREGLDVINLHTLERKLLRPLETYISVMEDNLHILAELKRHTDLSTAQARESMAGYIGNPVNSVLLIKRFTGSWSKIGEFTETENPAPG